MSITLRPLLVFCLLVHHSSAFEPRVKGGQNTTIEEYPFMVSIRFPSNLHKCGGSLISPEWVLTAAHCLLNDVGNIQYGSTQIDRNGKNVVEIEKIIIHEQFNVHGWAKNDIALIRLSKPIGLNSKVGIVKLPAPFQRAPINLPATIVGWGSNVTKGFSQDILQKFTYKIVNCANVKHPFISGTNICAKEYGKATGACHGDSGGPLLVDNIQFGIVSWSDEWCGNPTFPDIFTRVENYTKWIAKKMSKYIS